MKIKYEYRLRRPSRYFTTQLASDQRIEYDYETFDKLEKQYNAHVSHANAMRRQGEDVEGFLYGLQIQVKQTVETDWEPYTGQDTPLEGVTYKYRIQYTDRIWPDPGLTEEANKQISYRSYASLGSAETQHQTYLEWGNAGKRGGNDTSYFLEKLEIQVMAVLESDYEPYTGQDLDKDSK